MMAASSDVSELLREIAAEVGGEFSWNVCP